MRHLRQKETQGDGGRAAFVVGAVLAVAGAAAAAQSGASPFPLVPVLPRRDACLSSVPSDLLAAPFLH